MQRTLSIHLNASIVCYMNSIVHLKVMDFKKFLLAHVIHVSIMPLQSDYCDKCKEYKEEISRAQQIANRLKQSGHSSEQSIRDQEQIIAKYTGLLLEHKEEAQSGLEYYKNLVSDTNSMYMRISMLEKLPSTPENTTELKKLKMKFTAFISADFMMGKNLPYWGNSAQPSKTYYMMKLVHDIFGLVDHASKIKYAYLCDEVAAGPKSADHTITFFDHFLLRCILITGYVILHSALIMLGSIPCGLGS